MTAETYYADLIRHLEKRRYVEDIRAADALAAIHALLAENARLREVLKGIAKQRLWVEMSEEDQENADWTEGCEECVRRARAALNGETP